MDWKPVSLPLTLELLAVNAVWLRTDFDMPLNDTCSQWWLEFEAPLQGRLWLNEQQVVAEMLESTAITDMVAIGRNSIALRVDIENGQLTVPSATCVPYPC